MKTESSEKESPKSEMTVNVGGESLELKISFADLFDEMILKPLIEKLKKEGKEY